MSRLSLGMLLLATALDAALAPAHARTIDDIRKSGHLDCGVVQNSDDWDATSIHGDLSAFESEICRAVGVAILGQAAKVSIHAFPGENEGFKALKSHEVPLVIGLSPSASMAIQYGVQFGPPVFYDSQRVLVSKSSSFNGLQSLRDQLICALDMSPPERILQDVMTEHSVPFALMSHSEQGEMDAAIAVRHCTAGTAMETRLAQSRSNFHALTDDFVFLPDHLTLNPLVPAYLFDDLTFGLVVTWTIHALVEAEDLGIDRANIRQMIKRHDMRTDQFSGQDFATAQALGLSHDWAVNVVNATGNYGELFQRNLRGPYHLDRGLNALWTHGGLMYSPPMQ